MLAIYQAFAAHLGVKPGDRKLLREFFSSSQSPFSFLLPDADRIAAGPFRGRVTAGELRRRHSLTRVLAVGLRGIDADDWDPGVAVNLKESNFSRAHALRSCPHCVIMDVGRYGLAYWRLSHQWPTLRSCLEHACPLEIDCASCDSVTVRPRLALRADSACPSCGGTRRRPLSLPATGLYDDFCGAFDQALRGLLPTSEISSWMPRWVPHGLFREFHEGHRFNAATIQAEIKQAIGLNVTQFDALAIRKRRFLTLSRPASMRLAGLVFWKRALRPYDNRLLPF